MMKSWLLVLVASFSWPLAQAQSRATATPVADSFSSSQLEELIQQHQIRSIDELIPHLPESFRMTSSLIHAGRARLGASEKNPRVLLWSEMGGFALTYKSHVSERGPDTIEAFEYDRATSRLRFLELDFSESPRFEEKTTCLRCHGQLPRPIWGEYPTWKGVVGSHDDVTSAAELKMMNENQWWQNPRLAPLVPSAESPWQRPGFPTRHQPLDTKFESTFWFRMNMRFGIFASRITLDQITTKIIRQIEAEAKDAGAPLSLHSENARLQIAQLLDAISGCDPTTTREQALAHFNIRLKDIDLRTSWHPNDDDIRVDENAIYFDGMGTSWELLTARLLRELEKTDGVDFSSLKDSLTKKYPPVSRTNVSLQSLFQTLDSYSDWFLLPYEPTPLTRQQRREPWDARAKRNFGVLCQYLGTITTTPPKPQEVL